MNLPRRKQNKDFDLNKYNGDMERKFIPALEEIINDLRSDKRGRFPLARFGAEILPYLVSDDPEDRKLGERMHWEIANRDPFNEVELYDENGNTVCILPSSRARIPSVHGRRDEQTPITARALQMEMARSEDQMFGRAPGSYNSATGQIYQQLSREYETFGGLEIMIAWDQILTYFDYPSLFRPEEKADLIKRGYTFAWDANKKISTSANALTANEPKQEDTYEEDDWEV